MTRRAMIIASIGAVVALAVASIAFIALLSSSNSPSVNGAFGSISCSAPQLPGLKVNVTLSDAGDSMMNQEPMMATLTMDPATVHSGKCPSWCQTRGFSPTSWWCSHFPRTVQGRGEREPMARSTSPRAWERRHDHAGRGPVTASHRAAPDGRQ